MVYRAGIVNTREFNNVSLVHGEAESWSVTSCWLTWLHSGRWGTHSSSEIFGPDYPSYQGYHVLSITVMVAVWGTHISRRTSHLSSYYCAHGSQPLTSKTCWAGNALDGCCWTGFEPSILQLLMSQMAVSEQALSQACSHCSHFSHPEVQSLLSLSHGGFKKEIIEGSEGRRERYMLKSHKSKGTKHECCQCA